jgi:glycosyltransferase involved in cell wall biosynthesis
LPAATWQKYRIAPQPFDVVHVHNLFPNLSPSVLRTGAPTLMTLHNFRLACLPATFLREGAICEDCLGRVPWPGVVHGCYRGSRAQSAIIATSLSVHRAIGTFDRVTLFIAVSQFVKKKLVEAGFDGDRIRVRPNFSWPTDRRNGPGTYFLTLGRLSPEKGLETIVRMWGSRFSLVVVGDGPERARLESVAAPGVRFRGQVEPDDVPSLLRGARGLLMPSTCYEGSPRSLVEAFASGVPVVVSRIGGLPEHVEHDVSGLLVEPGDAAGWADAVGQLEDDSISERLGAGAYAAWEGRFCPDVGLRSLVALYEEAIGMAGRVGGGSDGAPGVTG